MPDVGENAELEFSSSYSTHTHHRYLLKEIKTYIYTKPVYKCLYQGYS
jgi:hypothetical protein